MPKLFFGKVQNFRICICTAKKNFFLNSRNFDPASPLASKRRPPRPSYSAQEARRVKKSSRGAKSRFGAKISVPTHNFPWRRPEMAPAAPRSPHGARTHLGAANNARTTSPRNSRPPKPPKKRARSASAATTFFGAGEKWSPLLRSDRTVPACVWAAQTTLGRPPQEILGRHNRPKRAPAAPRPPQLSLAPARNGPRCPAQPARCRVGAGPL